MKFKLDENFGRRTQSLFRARGHDVQTVIEEGLAGVSDRREPFARDLWIVEVGRVRIHQAGDR